MIKPDLPKIIKTERMNLTRIDTFWHYSPAIFFLSVPLIDLYFIIESYINKNQVVYDRMINGLGIVWVFLALSIIGFIIKYRSLNFKKLDSNIDSKRFKNAIDLTAKELNWTIIKRNDNYLFAHSWNSFWNWGEQIIIIRNNNNILINSMCKLSKPSYSSMGGNQKNIESFERNLKANAQHSI